MADKKISALTASTTPLAGTEVLPIVQGGATVKVAVSDLTAGRAISASSVTISGLTASTALGLDGSKNAISVTNTGTGNNVLATSPSIATPTLTGDVQMTTGNLVVGTAGKGIDFSADPSAPGMTSELLDDYEEGTYTPVIFPGSGAITTQSGEGSYTKVGTVVTARASALIIDKGTAAGTLRISLPFTAISVTFIDGAALVYESQSTGSFYNGIVRSGEARFEVQGPAWTNNYRYEFSVTYLVV